MLNTFPKSEKLVSRTLIDRLFAGGGKAMSAFPLRLVYMHIDEQEACTSKAATDSVPTTSKAASPCIPQQVLISVPKRCFKRAVKRNHVKRQIREAYRLHRDLFTVPAGQRLLIAFIWLDTNLHSSEEIEKKVITLLKRIK